MIKCAGGCGTESLPISCIDEEGFDIDLVAFLCKECIEKRENDRRKSPFYSAIGSVMRNTIIELRDKGGG